VTKPFKAIRWACVWTAVLLLACFAVAQDAALHIKIVAGDGGSHEPGSHVGKPLTVEVTDATGKPVAGAKVSFQVPEEGPSGLFTNGLRTDLATTDGNGRATVHGLQLNRVAGSFNVRITAAKEQARAGTIAKLTIGGAGEQVESADRKRRHLRRKRKLHRHRRRPSKLRRHRQRSSCLEQPAKLPSRQRPKRSQWRPTLKHLRRCQEPCRRSS
jgi:hypothetical protein